MTFEAGERTTSMRNTRTAKAGNSAGAPLWIVLAAGLLILLFAVASRAGDWPAQAERVDRFNASGKIQSLAIDNVSGDVEVVAGSAFSAVVRVTVRAESKDAAERILRETKVAFENDDGSLSLVTEEPGSSVWRNGSRWHVERRHETDRYRVETRYTVSLPSAASLEIHSLNGGNSFPALRRRLRHSLGHGRL